MRSHKNQTQISGVILSDNQLIQWWVSPFKMAIDLEFGNNDQNSPGHKPRPQALLNTRH
jgi:hypothetical protein